MSVKVLVGDALETLRTIPDQSVNCIVTSPPYFGLRNYGVDQQIGLEATPDQFVSALVGVFHEARRVLRDDGTLWLNLGDSYASTPSGGDGARLSGLQGGKTTQGEFRKSTKHKNVPAGLKQKDLIGIPWRVAFALQADGWYLRQDIIWHKPNPMPESVRDRCTKSHEHVFLLSKSQRYLFDAEAISEPVIKGASGSTFNSGKTALHQLGRSSDAEREESETRNKRDVWTIATEPSSIAHYAMMPAELAKTCIMAGCPLGGTVLDPFGGAGTTGLVADRLQRSAILIELSPIHAETARSRLQGDMGMFGAVG